MGVSVTWDSLLRGAGTFFTSPGFGGLAVVLGAWIGWRGVQSRLAGDREIAELAATESRDRELSNDSLNRWWELANWVDRQIDNRLVEPEELVRLTEMLGDSVTNQEQTVMVECLALKVIGGRDDR